MNQVGLSTEIELLPPFHDFDMMGVVWHGNYYKYFEIARTRLLQSSMVSLIELAQKGYYFPVTDTQCKYRIPIEYNTPIKIIAKVVAWDYQIKISFEIYSTPDNQRMANGQVTHTVVHKNSQGKFESCVPVPAEIAAYFCKECD